MATTVDFPLVPVTGFWSTERSITRSALVAAVAGQGAKPRRVLVTPEDLPPLLAAPEQRRVKIGACDWSIGKMGSPAAFEVAKEIGLDGVQVSLGTASNNMRLRLCPIGGARCPDFLLGADQQGRDMLARELLIKFQMSRKHPMVDLNKAYRKF